MVVSKQSSSQGSPHPVSGMGPGQEAFQFGSMGFPIGGAVPASSSQPYGVPGITQQRPPVYPVQPTQRESPASSLNAGVAADSHETRSAAAPRQETSLEQATQVSPEKVQQGERTQQQAAWSQHRGQQTGDQRGMHSQQQQQTYSNSYRNNQYQQQRRPYSANQVYVPPHNRGGGRGGGGHQMRGMRGGPRGGPPPRPNNRGRGLWRQSAETIKFDSEFDFESANAQFDKEEIEKELKQKLTIGGEKQINGEKSATEEEEQAEAVEEEEETPVYYDKTKSFFDNISCDATTKSQGRSNRLTWKDERKLNTETFGVSEARRGWRGRGRGRGGYNWGRGGYQGYGGYGGGFGGGRGGRGGYGGDRRYDDRGYNDRQYNDDRRGYGGGGDRRGGYGYRNQRMNPPGGS